MFVRQLLQGLKMSTYKIKGTLQVTISQETKFSLFPDSAYLSPDRKHAVLYDGNGHDAKLVELADSKFIKFKKMENSNEFLINNLIQLALDHKTVEIQVTLDCQCKASITGFTYPAR